MKPLRRAPLSPALLACLADDSTVAALKLLAELCRQMPDLRDWLWVEFTGNPEARARFAKMIDDPTAAPIDGANGFAQLTGEDRAWQKERQQLVDLVHQVALFAPSEEITRAEQAARSIFRARGFELPTAGTTSVRSCLARRRTDPSSRTSRRS